MGLRWCAQTDAAGLGVLASTIQRKWRLWLYMDEHLFVLDMLKV